MEQQGGVVYHPWYNAEMLAYPGGRVLLVRQLRAEADEASARGDNKVGTGDYDAAHRFWACSARYMRSAQAIGMGKPVDPDDYGIVGMAWRRVIEQQTQAKMTSEVQT